MMQAKKLGKKGQIKSKASRPENQRFETEDKLNFQSLTIQKSEIGISGIYICKCHQHHIITHIKQHLDTSK